MREPTPLLGGLSPATFMRRHWQREPLVVRAAVAEPQAVFDREKLFALAAQDGVESRLVVRDGDRWSLRDGPIARRSLPKLSQPGWTLLVQGVDLHDDAVHALLQRFRFVADARLDDAMVSFASDGGGVGPHVDSYDVFLIQLSGTRVWRIAPPARRALRDDVPLKMLARLVPRRELTIAAGDMLYLPPGWAHDGVAIGACLTCSIGFRSPDAASLARDLLTRIGEASGERDGAPTGRPTAGRGDRRYADASTPATREPARIPAALQRFADEAVRAAVADRASRLRALGEALSEPKPGTWFERPLARVTDPARGAIVLDRRTRMLYDDDHVYVNGEAVRATRRDATLLRRLADRRRLAAADLARASEGLAGRLDDWCEAGWCRRIEDDDAKGS